MLRRRRERIKSRLRRIKYNWNVWLTNCNTRLTGVKNRLKQNWDLTVTRVKSRLRWIAHNWDVWLVIMAMSVGFLVVVLKLIGYFDSLDFG